MVLYKMKKSVKAINISGLGESSLLPWGGGKVVWLRENTTFEVLSGHLPHRACSERETLGHRLQK